MIDQTYIAQPISFLKIHNNFQRKVTVQQDEFRVLKTNFFFRAFLFVKLSIEMILIYKRKFMILKKTIEIQLKKTISKIGFISIAYDNTVVFTRIDKVGFEQSLVHVNSKGQVLYELTYNCIIGQFGLLESKKVIIANTASNTIDIIDLQKQQVSNRCHNFINDNVLELDMICFFERPIAAIAQLNTYKKNQQLTFYHFQSQNIESAKQLSLSLGKRRVHFSKNIVKLNDKSKLAIYQRRNQLHFVFDVYELLNDKTVNQYRVKVEMPYNFSYFYMDDIWQTQQDHFLIFGSKCTDEVDRTEMIVNYNRWSNSNSYEPTFIALDANGKAQQRYWFITEQLVQNKWAIHKVIHFKQILVLKCMTSNERSPTYYINTSEQSEHIADFDNLSTSQGKLIKQFNELEYLQAQFPHKDIYQIKITSKMMTSRKDVLLHFMLSINEDFDDDLLQDALALLEEDF